MPEKKKILVTRRLPDAVEARAAEAYDATLNPGDTPYDRGALIAAAAGIDGLLCTITDKIDAELIAALPESVGIIATFSVGYEHIDLAAAKARSIAVSNTPGVLTDATADIALLLVLAATRRASEGSNMLRAGAWTGWTPTQLMGTAIQGKRLGILGMGEIGRAVAKRARAFEMDIHYHNRTRLDPEAEQGATYHGSIESLFRTSDVLSLHCPLTPDTHHLLNADTIAWLPEGAVVVNTARGPVVDDDALVAALTSGRLAAAGLDVFEGEPEIHPGYLQCANACLLPHLGSATLETRNAMGFTALDNIDAFFQGRAMPNRIA